ncbi:hypothetical protein P43SY_005643 [Pythium insidiosum]|uniref:RING-type domain-containing protein n=1 Tax=Pythium insidiosum TaxID=114742 RepID=A0AAD5LY53_PYTIN|nr:hypothetical protein P43SY_005643 [Pythium insidiosum]
MSSPSPSAEETAPDAPTTHEVASTSAASELVLDDTSPPPSDPLPTSALSPHTAMLVDLVEEALEPSRIVVPTTTTAIPTTGTRAEAVAATTSTALPGADQDLADPFFERMRLLLTTASHVPQIVATVAIAPNLWDINLASNHCGRELIWVLVQAMYLSMSVLTYWLWYWLAHWSQRQLSEHQRQRGSAIVHKLHVTLYIFGLLWFVIGNFLLLIVDAESTVCSDADHTGPTIFDLALVMLVMAYARVFWPCTVFLLLLPFAVLCRPCLLRLVNALGYEPPPPAEDIEASGPPIRVGASKELIEQHSKRVQFVKGMALRSSSWSSIADIAVEPNACCICLVDYELDDELRLLPCGHDFHVPCVDEWLARNASCPTCRKSIIPETHSMV